MGKNILKIEYDYDFLLSALISPVKDYHLCWHLNKLNGLELERKEDLEITDRKKKKRSHYSTYEFYDELNNYHFILVSNKCSGEYLIPELKQVDYFIMLKENWEMFDQPAFIEEIKQLLVIQTAFEVDPKNLKSKQNLIF